MKPIKTLFAVAPAVALSLGITTLAAVNGAHAESHGDMAEHGTMHVTKSPTCGCCGAWVELAREEGYAVEVTNTGAITVAKQEHDVPGALWACHTAVIDGYVVEGHVPFEAIAKLLEERPAVDGIAVAGMPAGSPGMGSDPEARYDVMAFGGDAGEGEVFFRAGS